MSTDGTTRTMPARKTAYKGTMMRSRLEARYAAWLDKTGVTWAYEPQCFANAAGQYLPDFKLENVPVLGSPRTLYVDVKPFYKDIDEVFSRMSVIWSTEPDAFLAIDAPPTIGGEHDDSSVYVAFPTYVGHYRYQLNAMWCLNPPDWPLSVVTNCTHKRWDYTA